MGFTVGILRPCKKPRRDRPPALLFRKKLSRSSQIRLWAAHSSIVVIGRGYAWLRLSALFGVAPSYHIFMGDPETQSGLR
jgi:hypothetical protein